MIIKYPNKILSISSTNVTVEEGQDIVEKLKEEIKLLNWGTVVGLAAPQIGINKNVFMALDKFYFNPKITKYSSAKSLKEEGCYSLEENKFNYKVWRSLSIEMEWQDYKGKHKKGKFIGFPAQILQHEYDHLQGKLCCGI